MAKRQTDKGTSHPWRYNKKGRYGVFTPSTPLDSQVAGPSTNTKHPFYEPRFNTLSDPDRHFIAVIGPFNTPPVYRCEYQDPRHSGIIASENEDTPDSKAKSRHEGSLSFQQHGYFTAIADWFTKTQQVFLKSARFEDLVLDGKAPPWSMSSFAKAIGIENASQWRDYMEKAWLCWPDKALNLPVIIEIHS